MKTFIVTMLQKPEEIRQERFQEYVNGLLLRFPNKTIAEKTGYKSGIISEYIRGIKPVSEKFLRVFCEKFGADFDYLMGNSTDEVNLNSVKSIIIISQRHLLI